MVADAKSAMHGCLITRFDVCLIIQSSHHTHLVFLLYWWSRAIECACSHARLVVRSLRYTLGHAALCTGVV